MFKDITFPSFLRRGSGSFVSFAVRSQALLRSGKKQAISFP